MKDIDNNTITETDEYLIYLSHQYIYFLNYLNKDVQTVYHYTSGETLNKIFKSSTLRFSNINYLNDECEFTYLYMVLYDLVPRYRLIYSKPFCDFIEETCSWYCNKDSYFVCEEIKKDLNRQYYVSSFSLNNDSLPLWTLYTKKSNFIGCNFSVNPNELNKILDLYFHGRVIYSEKEQIQILNELIASWFKKYEHTYYKDYFLGDIRDYLYKYALFFKHPAFEQEQEYRFIKKVNSNEKINDGNNKPYIDMPFNATNIIHSITLAPTLKKQEENIDYYNNIIKQYNIKNIEVNVSSIPFISS